MNQKPHTSSMNRDFGKSIMRPPVIDSRSHPAYYHARGYAPLATGGRKRQIGGQP